MDYHPHTGFHYLKLLTYMCHDYNSFSSNSGLDFVGVEIGNFLNDLGARNIFNTNLHCMGAC